MRSRPEGFQLVQFYCGFGIRDFHRAFESDGLMNRTAVEPGHASFFFLLRGGPCAFVVFSSTLAVLLTFKASGCPDHLKKSA